MQIVELNDLIPIQPVPKPVTKRSYRPLAQLLSPKLLADAKAATVQGSPLFKSLQPRRSARVRAA